MRSLHLFAGAGGGLLCDLILGHEPIAAVEWDAYCCQILRERAADGWFPGLRVHEGDVRLFDPSEYAGRVDCIHAGFPCQDISAAGKGAGITGARSGLVSEVFRAIDAIRPRFVFLENSPRIESRGRPEVIAALVARGYAYRDGTIAASDVGAWHKRERWFCLSANADGLRQLQQEGGEPDERGWIDYGNQKIASDLMRPRRAIRSGVSAAQEIPNLRSPVDLGTRESLEPAAAAWFEAEPALDRLVYGIPDGMVPASNKALGNAQVPLQAALAWKLLGGP